jgi:hypothetical protein
LKLKNLVKRRSIYGDITQSVSGADKLEELLKRFNNHVPDVIFYLEQRNRRRGSQTYIPPAFFDRDGAFHQPPSFEMTVSGKKGDGVGGIGIRGHQIQKVEEIDESKHLLHFAPC